MKYYYYRLKDLREDRSEMLKQQDIADLLGTTQQTYSQWERGEREIPFHHAITLAKFYNVSLDYIAGLTNSKNPGSNRSKRSVNLSDRQGSEGPEQG